MEQISHVFSWRPQLYHHVYVGIILPQEALLAAAVIISSYLATEDRTIEKDMIEGNWLEAAAWVSYSSRTKFKARAKIRNCPAFGGKGCGECGSCILFCERGFEL